ncbi:hypothetical protein G9A89_000507 [Geosiphon pyriformis]|nr:hypothetical protein G9A89_000507 [Geosiphon pyriformis]
MSAGTHNVLIVGAGLGGLTLAQALMKSENPKFRVLVFERDKSAEARSQGYHIGLLAAGAQALVSSLPDFILKRLPHAVPDHMEGEKHGLCIVNHTGKILATHKGKHANNVYELAKSPENSRLCIYRHKLRELLLEGVTIKWGKRCIGYEETKVGVWAFFDDGTREFGDMLVGCDGIHSAIRKQKFPESRIRDIGITFIAAHVAAPEKLVKKFLSLNDGNLTQISLGLDGHCHFWTMRFRPIFSNLKEVKNENQSRFYHLTITYSFPHIFSNSSQIGVEDIPEESSKALLDEVKAMILKTRPACELTNLILEMWSLVKPEEVKLNSQVNQSSDRNMNEFIPPRKQSVREIDQIPEFWKSTRVTLLGDAIHAMSPYRGTHAYIDACSLANCLKVVEKDGWEQCIGRYEEEMRKRTSIARLDVLFHGIFV